MACIADHSYAAKATAEFAEVEATFLPDDETSLPEHEDFLTLVARQRAASPSSRKLDAILRHFLQAGLLYAAKDFETTKLLLSAIRDAFDRWSQVCPKWGGLMMGVFSSEWMAQCEAEMSTALKSVVRAAHDALPLTIPKTVTQAVPREIISSFLENPYELVMVTETKCHTFSLQSGKDVFQEPLYDPKSKALLLMLLQPPNRNDFQIAPRIAPRPESSCRVENLHVDSAGLFLYWSVKQDGSVTFVPPLLASEVMTVTAPPLPHMQVFRVAATAISRYHNWLACWTECGLLLFDIESGDTTIIDEQPAVAEDNFPFYIFQVVAVGQHLLVGNEATMRLFSVTRMAAPLEGTRLVWSQVWCNEFMQESYHVHIAALDLKDDVIGALIRANCTSTYSYVALCSASVAEREENREIRRIHGCDFCEMALAQDLVITMTFKDSMEPYLVQIWPTVGPAHCLLRLMVACYELPFLRVMRKDNTEKLLDVAKRMAMLLESPSSSTMGLPELSSANAESAHSDDAPADIDQDEARAVTQELWASGVERRLQGLSIDVRGPVVTAVLLHFSRQSPDLDDALLDSKPARMALSHGVDVQPPWAHGAKIFVEGFDSSLANELDIELRPWHVVVSQTDEPLIHDALRHLPFNLKKMKPGIGRRFVPGGLDLMDVSSEGEHEVLNDAQDIIEIRVRRTFLEIPAPHGAPASSSQSAP
mmetsp:Transcript_88153/g.174964  ORF Transcript_88153/g.174964 Transcript_88153/m.174964 type:complete len:706 (+) Transcript_88153:38-2155(+)